MSKARFREYLPGAEVRHGERVYGVEERISCGKFGFAFACRDDQGYPRMLQVVWPFSQSYENERERWRRQAAELQQVRHPDLVQLLDGFEHDGCFHLVHERCDDRLDRLIVSPAWDGRRWFKAVARPVLCALDEAHRSGYAHRNLHPRNVLCTLHLGQVDPDSVPSGAIKLGDLAVNTLLGKVDVLNTKLARSWVPPEYLSPSECGPMDHRMDIYQTGLLLLCILKGRILRYSFEEISIGLPAKQAEALEPGYGQVLARALQLRVTDRFPSALEFWQAVSGPRPISAGGAEQIFREETSACPT